MKTEEIMRKGDFLELWDSLVPPFMKNDFRKDVDKLIQQAISEREVKPITDHDLGIIAEDWYSDLVSNNIGRKTAFAAGYRTAERNLLTPYQPQEGIKTADELGDKLCDYCPLEKKGVYSVPGGFAAGCEGSKCKDAYENYLIGEDKP